ncbi:MAG TPA: SAM-dependent methyltransferase [Usitatibacter sp.]|jgi:16S rRNA (cytidine1402-2'-O)-methyltransferase|nr:SAM-dependent methyltransferase [Usitatibacter sp.]
MSPGTLHLLPAWLSQEAPPEAVVPAAVLERIRALDAFIAEDAKSARAWLAACRHPKALREISISEYSEHTPDSQIARLLEPLAAGRDVGLVSEAGLPAIADPGAPLVAEARRRGIRVVPHVGPSSIFLALMASGLPGQRFRFVGYLPAQSAARRAAIAELERQSARAAETQVFIETPYRGDALLADLVATCKPATRIAVAVDLTSPREWIRSDRAEAWRERPRAIGRNPAIFLLSA